MTTEEIVEIETRHGKVRGWASRVFQFAAISTELDAKERQWITNLRSIGIKAAHPDDGHVNRKKHEHWDYVHFQYPQFNDDPQVGDMIALGWHDKYRVRKVLRIESQGSFFRDAPYYVVLK